MSKLHFAYEAEVCDRMMRLVLLMLTVTAAAACADSDSESTVPVAVVEESFLTRPEPRSNMDSPALWTGAAGEAWLLATGKRSNRLYVYDAATGALLRTVGRRGSAPGEFRRPNGIEVSGNLVLVVERDNARVQVLHLPDFTHVASFGEHIVRRPYGIAVLKRDSTEIQVFVTDDYRGFLGRTPSDRELGQRVKHFRVAVSGNRAAATYVGAFGATAGPGRLRKVESIALDAHAGTLLIADEEARNVKVYRLDGSFTGQVLWRDVLRHDPEGIALYSCDQDDGHWIIADQHRTENRFLVFDRKSFRWLGAFAGRTVRNTDGIALAQRGVGPMAAGVLYVVHNDRAIGAFSWTDVAAALKLRDDCVE